VAARDRARHIIEGNREDRLNREILEVDAEPLNPQALPFKEFPSEGAVDRQQIVDLKTPPDCDFRGRRNTFSIGKFDIERGRQRSRWHVDASDVL
jgi:hypothetical protein